MAVDVSEQPFELPEGLRERKKRLMRELLTNTATVMFLTRGFNEVKVSDVAAACGVSEKTVYNYFPTKESLLLDREDEMAAALRRYLGSGNEQSPVEAMLDLIDNDLADLQDGYADFEAQFEGENGLGVLRRFNELIETVPSLRAFHLDMMDRLVGVAAEALAERAGMAPDAPEPQVAAVALLGLYRIHSRAMSELAGHVDSVEELLVSARREVARAAKLIESGLWSFDAVVLHRQAHAQSAADAAAEAKAQVQAAMKEARKAWRDLRRAGQAHDAAERLKRRGR